MIQLGMSQVRRTVDILEGLSCSALIEDYLITTRAARDRLAAELDYYRRLRIEDYSISEIFERYCLSIANRQQMFQVLLGGQAQFDQTLARYRTELADFHPARVLERFSKDPTEPARRLAAIRGLDRKSLSWQLNNPRSSFNQYVRGIFSGAKFFSQFEDGHAFKKFIAKWLVDPDLTAMLPEFLHKLGLEGLGPGTRQARQVGHPDHDRRPMGDGESFRIRISASLLESMEAPRRRVPSGSSGQADVCRRDRAF